MGTDTHLFYTCSLVERFCGSLNCCPRQCCRIKRADPQILRLVKLPGRRKLGCEFRKLLCDGHSDAVPVEPSWNAERPLNFFASIFNHPELCPKPEFLDCFAEYLNMAASL